MLKKIASSGLQRAGCFLSGIASPDSPVWDMHRLLSMLHMFKILVLQWLSIAAIAHAISAIRLIHFIGKVLELLQSLSIVELLGQNLRSQLLKLDLHLF